MIAGHTTKSTLKRKHRIQNVLIRRVNILPKHIQGTFSSLRYFKANLEAKFNIEKQFLHVILDHFYCPNGYAGDRWADGLYKDVLVYLLQHRMVINGSIFLPNNRDCMTSITKYEKHLSRHCTIVKVSNPRDNPLYLAGENVAPVLENLGVCNKTALVSLDPNWPYIRLSKIEVLQPKPQEEASTASKKQKLAILEFITYTPKKSLKS